MKKVSNWELGEIKIQDLINEIRTKVISIPSFQRGVVWKKDAQDKLIDSIKKGYPYGSILIHRDENKKQLIDGLQRSVTLYSYLDNPANYFNETDILDSEIDKIYELARLPKDRDKSELMLKMKNIIIRWIKSNCKTIEDINNIQYIDIISEITKEFPTIENSDDLRNIISGIIQRFKNKTNQLADKKVPVIYYDGDSALLPEVFERINSQGTNLSKYQIFAATWNKKKFKLTSGNLTEIVKIVSDRYNKLGNDTNNKKIIEVDDFNYNNFIEKSEVNTFELAYGFGKLISKEYPNLFKETDLSIIDNIGFNLINSCLVQPANEISKLDVNISNLIGKDKLEGFLNAIIRSIKVVNDIITPIAEFKGNNRVNKPNIPHTELQIVSMIATHFIKNNVEVINFQYDDSSRDIIFDFKSNKRNLKEENENFINNALKHYVVDILNNEWRGSGDSTLNNKILNDSNYYFKDIVESNYRFNMITWFNNDKKTKNERSKFGNPKSHEIMLLNIIYLNVFSANDHLGKNRFDIEHLIPKNRMKNKMKKNKLFIPGSSIGNVSYLPEGTNRAKKDKTIYEYGFEKDKLIEIEEKYSFTKRDDFNFLTDYLTDEEFVESFNIYVDERFENELLPRIISYLYKKN